MPKNDQLETVLTDRQERVIAEIRRVAKVLGVTSLSKREFDKYHELGGLSTAGYQFGSWNRAVRAAGLEPNIPSTGSKPVFTEDELLDEILRLQTLLGKPPTDREMGRFGKFSPKPYTDRWGTFVKARGAAYDRAKKLT